MSEQNREETRMSDDELQELVAQSDTGGRTPHGLPAKILMATALAWSLFQIWIVSPLPFLDWPVIGSFGVFNDTEARSIHLATALRGLPSSCASDPAGRRPGADA